MNHKVLIVEDEQPLRDVYALILKANGYDVYTAENGEKGLDMVRKHQPQLVLLDILMPIMDGRDFLRNMDLTEHPQIKVIVFSNTSDGSLRSEMIELGANEVVLKADKAPADLVSLVQSYFSA